MILGLTFCKALCGWGAGFRIVAQLCVLDSFISLNLMFLIYRMCSWPIVHIGKVSPGF